MPVERMIELENRIEELKEKSVQELINDGFTLQDVSFIARAILIPLDNFAELIMLYDNSVPKIDEATFINNIVAKYNTNFGSLVKRIKEVREINKFRSLESGIKR